MRSVGATDVGQTKPGKNAVRQHDHIVDPVRIWVERCGYFDDPALDTIAQAIRIADDIGRPQASVRYRKRHLQCVSP